MIEVVHSKHEPAWGESIVFVLGVTLDYDCRGKHGNTWIIENLIKSPSSNRLDSVSIGTVSILLTFPA